MSPQVLDPELPQPDRDLRRERNVGRGIRFSGGQPFEVREAILPVLGVPETLEKVEQFHDANRISPERRRSVW